MTTPAVSWQEWGAAAFEQARSEGKLVFLDITARWCHWCHVLDRTSLSDPSVAAALERDYVAVRVDTDRRPDINDRYNQGGWPSVAVLLPDGRILTGATYLPPDSLLSVLDKCAAFYRTDRGRIDAWIAGNSGHPGRGGDQGPAVSGEAPTEELLPLVRQAVMGQIDPVDLGFFGEPKFLMVDALAFLRDGWLLEPGVETGETFLAILRRMVRSDVFDAVEGGFFRYATKRDWTVPHYEKLLADNAGMLSLCASAHELSGDPLFADAARGTLRFLLLSLFDRETGAFFSSGDADEAYYALKAHERALRNPPAVDRTIISEYNAAAVTALVASARAFPPGGGDASPDDGLLQRAIGLGEFLWGMSGTETEGQIRYRDEAGTHAGHLSDNVAVAAAYLELWDATRSPEWLERATLRLEWMLRNLFDRSRRRFADRLGNATDDGLLKTARYPFPLNAAAASSLVRCGREAMRADLFAAGRALLGRLAEDFDERMGPFAAAYGSALLRYWHGSAGKGCLPGDPACEG